MKSYALDFRSIRARRELLQLSREELARQAGIGRSTVYLIEDGLTDVKVNTLIKIAMALKLHPAELWHMRQAA